MTTIYESPTERQDDIDNVARCLGMIVDINCDFPDEHLDYSHFPQKVQDDLEELLRVTGWLVYEGAATLWEYAKIRGLADDIATMAEAGRLPCRNWGATHVYVRELTGNWREEMEFIENHPGHPSSPRTSASNDE
jgi:hypothetical protein